MIFFRILTSAITIFLPNCFHGQTVADIYKYCKLPIIGQIIRTPSTQFESDVDIRDVNEISYKIRCDHFDSIYGRRIEKIQVKLDKSRRVVQMGIYVPFDTLLHREMETDLGQPEFGWIAMRNDLNIEEVISPRFWSLQDFRVGFSCTRYSFMYATDKKDFIIISILPKLKE
jgi:hypothetical protein